VPSDGALFGTAPLFLNLNNAGRSRRFPAAEQAGRHLFLTCYAPVIDLLFENRWIGAKRLKMHRKYGVRIQHNRSEKNFAERTGGTGGRQARRQARRPVVPQRLAAARIFTRRREDRAARRSRAISRASYVMRRFALPLSLFFAPSREPFRRGRARDGGGDTIDATRSPCARPSRRGRCTGRNPCR